MEITGAWALSLPFGPTTKSRLYQGSACRRWIRPRDCSPLGRGPSSHWLTSSSPPFHGLRQGCSSFLILGRLFQVREWVWSGLISRQGICWQMRDRRFENNRRGLAWKMMSVARPSITRYTIWGWLRTNNFSGNVSKLGKSDIKVQVSGLFWKSAGVAMLLPPFHVAAVARSWALAASASWLGCWNPTVPTASRCVAVGHLPHPWGYLLAPSFPEGPNGANLGHREQRDWIWVFQTLGFQPSSCLLPMSLSKSQL